MVYEYLYFGFIVENSMQTIQIILKRIKTQTQPTKTTEGQAYWGEEYRTKQCCVVYRPIVLLRLECSAQFQLPREQTGKRFTEREQERQGAALQTGVNQQDFWQCLRDIIFGVCEVVCTGDEQELIYLLDGFRPT